MLGTQTLCPPSSHETALRPGVQVQTGQEACLCGENLPFPKAPAVTLL